MTDVTPKSEVHPSLWVGPAPAADPAVEGFTLLALCARQHQSVPFGVRKVCAPLTDDAFEIVKGDVERCQAAAEDVAQELRKGGRVLVTCMAGQNRSSWVAGRAMVLLGVDPHEAIQKLEVSRNFINWFFKQELLGTLPPRLS